MKVDKIDLKILKELQENSKETFVMADYPSITESKK